GRIERIAAAQAIVHLRIRQRVTQRLQPARLRARVGHPQAGALAGAPARGGDTRLAQSEDQDERRSRAGGVGTVHRNVDVESPAGTSIMLMIPKRATTWVSVQPPTSKGWCSGAMRKIRRPCPYVRLVYLNHVTCIITDSVSTTNPPPMMNRTISCRTITAIVPSAPPSARAPTSPMNTRPGEALNP